MNGGESMRSDVSSRRRRRGRSGADDEAGEDSGAGNDMPDSWRTRDSSDGGGRRHGSHL